MATRSSSKNRSSSNSKSKSKSSSGKPSSGKSSSAKAQQPNRLPLILGAVIVLVILAAAVVLLSNNNAGGSVVQDITPQQYQTQFGQTNTPHFLLDVRRPDEFSTGHIAGAANIAVETLADNLASVPRDMPVIVYCHSGNRSAQAAQILKDAGYTQIYDMGGINDWEAAGYPIE